MPLRILIADDNAVFRNTLRQVLSAVDHWDIVEARDGQEAVSKAAGTKPNVVILDLAMPVKDGLAAAREISQILPETPILMYTLHMTPHLHTEALKYGIRKVLSKSDSSPLIEAVKQFLPARQTTATVPEIEAVSLPDPAIALATAAPSTTKPADPISDAPTESQPKSVA
jgi:DNA-binding NarL/FixJ family response regulator